MDTRDWSLCFICQSLKTSEKTLNPSLSIKLRNTPEKLIACYKEVVNNIQELKELGDLPDFVVVNSIDGGGVDGGGNGDSVNTVVDKMISNSVVWHNAGMPLIARKLRGQEKSMKNP